MTRATRPPLLAVVLTLATLSCATLDEGPPTPELGLLYALQVESALEPSAQKAMLFQRLPFNSPGDSFLDHPTLVLGEDSSGRRLVNVMFSTNQERVLGNVYEAWFTLDPEGAVQRLRRPRDAPALPRKGARILVADGAESPLVIQCAADWRTAFWLDGAASLVSGDLPADFCAAQVQGRSSQPNHVVLGFVDGPNLRLESRDLTDGTLTRSAALPLPAHPLLVQEDPGGALVAIVGDATTLWRIGTDGIETSIQRPFPLGNFKRDPTTGRVLILDEARAALWDADDPTAAAVLTSSPSAPYESWRPLGSPGFAHSGEYSPNERDQTMRVPERYSVRSFVREAFSVTQAATTPCVSRSTCRNIGESYLVASFDSSAGPVGLYAFWSWTGYLAAYVTPVSRPDEPPEAR